MGLIEDDSTYIYNGSKKIGTDESKVAKVTQAYLKNKGYNVQFATLSDPHEFNTWLQKGYIVVLGVGSKSYGSPSNLFTTGRHYITLIGRNSSGNIITVNSNNETKFLNAYSVSTLQANSPSQVYSDGKVHTVAYKIGSLPFVDLTVSSLQMEAIETVYARDYMSGTSATTFNPTGTLTRAEAVQVIYTMAGRPSSNTTISFSDVSPNAWYYDAVKWAAGAGITSGTGNNKFSPNDKVTREQLACMMHKYKKAYGVDDGKRANLSNYSDASSIASWARDSVQWALAHGVLTTTGSNISPQSVLNRADTAVASVATMK